MLQTFDAKVNLGVVDIDSNGSFYVPTVSSDLQWLKHKHKYQFKLLDAYAAYLRSSSI